MYVRSRETLKRWQLLLYDGTQKYVKQHDSFWTTLPGFLVLVAGDIQSNDKYVQDRRSQFYRLMGHECIKTTTCRASTQMSVEQYAVATSHIEERIQKPLLLVEGGLRAELDGKKELAEKLQSAEALNAELLPARTRDSCWQWTQLCRTAREYKAIRICW